MTRRHGPSKAELERREAEKRRQDRQERDDRARMDRERINAQNDAIASYARSEAQRANRTYANWRDETGRAGRSILDHLFKNRR